MCLVLFQSDTCDRNTTAKPSRELKSIHDDRCWFVEVLNNYWDIFQRFGRAYIITAYAAVVRANNAIFSNYPAAHI